MNLNIYFRNCFPRVTRNATLYFRLTSNWSSASTGSRTPFSTKTTRVWFDYKSSSNLRLSLMSRLLFVSYLRTKTTGQKLASLLPIQKGYIDYPNIVKNFKFVSKTSYYQLDQNPWPCLCGDDTCLRSTNQGWPRQGSKFLNYLPPLSLIEDCGHARSKCIVYKFDAYKKMDTSWMGYANH